MTEPDTPTPPRETRRGRSPGKAWRRVAYGIHRLPSEDARPDVDLAARAAARRESLVADLWAWQPVLREGACFTHLTSAIVRGWWLPQLPGDLPIWIAQTSAQHASRRGGVRVIRRPTATPYEEIEGLRLATAAETIAACAVDLALLDLVMLIDCALHRGDVTLEELGEVAATRRRGAPRLREALTLCDARTESAWETPFRLLHRVCGIPVVPQVDIHHDGRFVARADLVIGGTRSIHEFDGAGHRDRDQHRSDLARDRGLADARVTRRGYTAADLRDQPHAIVADACVSLGRPFAWELLTPWWPLWNDSCFALAGRRRLAARIRVGATGEKVA